MLVMNAFGGRTCPQSDYWTGKECCPSCPAGSRVKTDCTEFKGTSCLPCTEGTFMHQPTGRKQCYKCRSCDEDYGLKMKARCTTTSDIVCEALDGFFCTAEVVPENSCVAAQEHKLCERGQYISQPGTSSTDTECSDCSDGTYSNGTSTSCQTHTQCEFLNLLLIRRGNVTTDAECGEQILDMRMIIVIVIVFLLLIIGLALYKLIKKKLYSRRVTGLSFHLDYLDEEEIFE